MSVLLTGLIHSIGVRTLSVGRRLSATYILIQTGYICIYSWVKKVPATENVVPDNMTGVRLGPSGFDESNRERRHAFLTLICIQYTERRRLADGIDGTTTTRNASFKTRIFQNALLLVDISYTCTRRCVVLAHLCGVSAEIEADGRTNAARFFFFPSPRTKK